MKILVAAATPFEIESFVNKLSARDNDLPHEFYICITGIGMMHTTYTLTKAITFFGPEMVIQAGVAGAFDHRLQLGEVVMVEREYQGDLGVENRETYQDIFETGLLLPDQLPYQKSALVNPMHNIPFGSGLRLVRGLTVNTVSGSDDTIRQRSNKYSCDVESMEGAAFHYVCLSEHLPFLQLRAISNYVEPRDKSKWKMKEAIKSLNDYLETVLL